MKTHMLAFLVIAACDGASASPLINLDFETVNTNTTTFIPDGLGYPTGYGSIEDLLPGWQITCENREVTQIGFNGGGPPNSPGYVGIISREAHPSFRVYAQGDHVLYLSFFEAPQITYVLTQRGDIPAGAIAYAVDGLMSYLPVQLSLNGTIIGQDHDISAFQGQKDVEFSLTVFSPEIPDIPSPDWTYIDTISFVVPEPSTSLLFLVGGLAMGWFACRGGWK